MLITCSYKNQEFVRVGYYVNVEYDNEEMRTTPPSTLQYDRLNKILLAEKPRVTRFPIKWDDLDEQQMPETGLDDDEMDTEHSMNEMVDPSLMEMMS